MTSPGDGRPFADWDPGEVAEVHALAIELGALRIGPALLASGDHSGPLGGVPMVVKDLIDVAGVATGAGNPDFLADAQPASAHAAAVARMLDAGVDVIGKSHTDELAFSLSGTNVHYGTPRNPRDRDRVPGGSSSGSASAVAGGLVPLALATDTGGSIRVPASYCGIYGFRPTHGRVPLVGVIEFAPSFGTVGILTKTPAMLAAAGLALLDTAPVPQGVTELVVATDLLGEADHEVAAAVADAALDLAGALGIPVRSASFAPGRLTEWLRAFRGRQMVEAWASHGTWIERRSPRFGPGIGARYAQARSTPPEEGVAAGPAGEEVRQAIDDLLAPGGAMVLPAAASVAPRIDLEGPGKDDLRLRTLRLTCVAGLGGLPAISLPLAEVDGLPVGCCIVGRTGDDERMLASLTRLGLGYGVSPAGR